MESPPLPRYTFSQTVFSPGSTTFSGSFDFSGPTPSSFNGQFTGPNAQELMAQFTAPFRDWDAQENPTVWGVMNGVMVGPELPLEEPVFLAFFSYIALVLFAPAERVAAAAARRRDSRGTL